ncbi:MAG TPA: ABC transporter ATP-binding protein [Acidimicrobiales bacterium]|nr:ABC transporter ATP-binding protein [Acidimicrobiales bacterium]
MNISPSRLASTSDAIVVDRISKRFGSVPVLRDVSLRVAPGSVVALLGPSGCGKTTLLRTIAGLEVPDSGTVAVGERVLTSSRTVVPPERRQIGMVFQDWALFPHLSVGRNVAYGLDRAARRSRRVDETLALVGLAGLADRAPGTLSGGQQQRVALARALAPQPLVLLLDEPFSNLDTSLRVEVRTEVHRLLAELGVTTVFVTHDQEEAFVLGDEVAVMRDGAIEQQATPAEIYAAPASPWVAGFVGDANLVVGTADGEGAATPVGWVPVAGDPTGPRLEVLLRPEDLRVAPGDAASVELVEFYGHDTVYDIRLDDGSSVRARVGAAPTFRRGDRVDISYLGPPASAWGRERADRLTVWS